MFIDKESIAKKLFFTGTVFLVLLVGIFIFYSNLRLVGNFKPYYAKSYFASFTYRVANPYSNLAGLFSFFRSPGEVYQKTDFKTAVSIPVLTYHGAVGSADGVNVEIDTFIDQMKALKRSGWQTITIDEYYKWYKGETSVPEKSFLLTFDDGRKDGYYPVEPILNALDYNAAVFVITKYSFLEEKSTYYLTQEELLEMQESGHWEIQSHAYEVHDDLAKISAEGDLGHALSNLLWLEDEGRLETEEEFRARIFRDFSESKRVIEEAIGREVLSFAFPFGDFGEGTVNFPKAKEIILETGRPIYPLMFHQQKSGDLYTFNYQNGPESEAGLVRRISVEANWSGEDLLKILGQGVPKNFPYSDNFSENRGWLSSGWGEYNLKENELYLGASPTGTGNVVILNGTGHWKDYDLDASVTWPRGRNIYIWGRYVNDRNYIACNFAKNLIHIEQIHDGSLNVIKGTEDKFNFPASGEEFEIGMRISGRHAECLLNGQVVVETDFLNPELDHGGIGFKSWDPQLGVSQFIIKSLDVSEVN